MNKDYVRTARAKGLTEKVVANRHIRRNAMIPVATVSGSMVLGLLGGVVIGETVFDYKGIGLLTATGAQQLDYTHSGDYTVLRNAVLINPWWICLCGHCPRVRLSDGTMVMKNCCETPIHDRTDLFSGSFWWPSSPWIAPTRKTKKRSL